jgi:lantibiotic transport system permease protein
LPQKIMRFVPMLYVSLLNPLVLKARIIEINQSALMNLFVVFFVELGIFIFTKWYTNKSLEV